MSASEFAYAQARLQARHAERPDEGLWMRLRATTSYAAFLSAAASTVLRGSIAHLHTSHDARDIERSLHADFRERVDEIASWLPDRWQPATRFVAELPLVPFVLEKLGRDGVDRHALVGWQVRWQTLWPSMPRAELRALGALHAALSSHFRDMASADSQSDGWLLRAELASQLERLFRAEREQPAPVFCHLALTALDLERLRGALLRRLLFEDVGSDVAWV